MNENHFPALTAYLASVQSACPSYFKKLEDIAQAEQIPIVYPETARFLNLLVKLKKPQNVLELGAAIGYSALWLAEALDKEATLYTIEASKPNVVRATQNFKEFAPEKNIIIQEAFALKYLEQDTKQYDLIFVDSEKKEYLQILAMALPRLTLGGIIIFDNLLWHGQVAGVGAAIPKYQTAVTDLKKFNSIFVSHPQLQAVILPIGDGVGIGVKKNV